MISGEMESTPLADPRRIRSIEDLEDEFDLEPALEPLQPRRVAWSQRHVRWQKTAPKGAESARWQSIDDRWIAIALGEGDDAGRAVVTSSEGRRAVVDTYEQALMVAETWQS